MNQRRQFPGPDHLSHSKIARDAAKAAVEEFVQSDAFKQVVEDTVNATLTKIGIDVQDPKAMRAAMTRLRSWSDIASIVREKGIGTIVTGIITMLMTALAVGIAVLFLRGGATH